MPLRRTARLLAIGLVGLAVGGCVGSSGSLQDYKSKASKTVETVDSSVKTVRLAVRAVEENRTFYPYVSVVIVDAADDASSAQDSLDAVQPPNEEADAVKTLTDRAVGDAIDTLEQARTYVRREDRDKLIALGPDLDAASDQLGGLQEGLR